MKEKDKTKEQLINELDELRRQLVEIKALESTRKRAEEELLSEKCKLSQICDSIDEIIYVADPVTHEVLFANRALRELFGKDLIGGICYRDFQGLESPCEFCTNEIILREKEKPHRWEFHNQFLNRHFMIVDKIIKWPDGRDVRLEFAVDITRRKKVAEDFQRRLKLVETVERVSSRFVGIFDYDDAINASLADIGSISGAHRSYLFFFNKDGDIMNNTHEWCAEGVSPQIDNLKNLPAEIFPWWIGKLRKGESIHITDVSMLPVEAKAEKEILQSQDIKSLLVLPLYIKGALSGFLGFDNVSETSSWSNDDLALLRVFSEIIGNALERKQAEERLQTANRQLSDIIEFLPDATFVIDHNKKVIAWNRAIEEMTGVRKEDILGRSDYAYAVPFYGKPRPVLLDLIFKDDKDIVQCYDFVKKKGNTLYAEVLIKTPFGKEVFLWVNASPLFDSEGNLIGAIESIRDITERKRAEDQLKYLSLHDSLTGLYNRTYFEEEMRRLENGRYDPVGIIVCDVNGLKFVNDTLGHDVGDSLLVAAAGVIQESLRENDMAARIGGDEFAVLIPNTDVITVESTCNKIQENMAKHNEASPGIPLSISVGFAVRNNKSQSMAELFKEADNNMYREKLHHSQSVRSSLVQPLMKALGERDFITEGHADRLQGLVTNLAKSIRLSESKIADLRLLAQFHDIGKVGIPDNILFKPGPLTEEECREMKRHCEIGYRIAQTANDLLPIADWILKHHEWWNGEGYPLGLKGEEIPLECRILAIADAYDAMTSNRSYRRGRSHRKAKAELLRCAGKQFDPYLVEKFIQVIENSPGLNRSRVW